MSIAPYPPNLGLARIEPSDTRDVLPTICKPMACITPSRETYGELSSLFLPCPGFRVVETRLGDEAMPEVRMTIQVAHDKTVVAIELATLGQPPQRIVLGLPELDRLISELGDARSQMVAGQPQPDFESNEVMISTAANTKWCIQASPPTGALFAFHHPKFGPVGLTLPRDQIAKIVSFLTDRFVVPPTPSAKKH